MSNCKKCNNRQNRNPQHPKRDALPFPNLSGVAIHLPEVANKDGSVTIPLDWFVALIHNDAILDTIERWAKAQPSYSKIDLDELIVLLGVEREDAK